MAGLEVEARKFDYDQPEELAGALQGIDKLLLISSSEIGKRYSQHQAVIQAAQAAGVGHLVYTSLLHADSSSLGLAQEHLATEQALRESGIPYTILRNGWYNENYSENVGMDLAAGALYTSAGAGKVSSAAREDYAEAAAVVLTRGSHTGATYELAGDQAFTMQDYAREIAAVAGKPFQMVEMTDEAYAGMLEKVGMAAPMVDFLTGIQASTRQNDLYDDHGQLGALIGRTTTSIAESLRQQL